MSISAEFYMRLAIKKAKQGLERSQVPFGACLVQGDSVLGCAHNQVYEDMDITAHSVILAIREACHKLKTIDLSGCTLFATSEPCPMCLSALQWANIRKLYYGTSLQEARALGFRAIEIPSGEFRQRVGSSWEIVEGFLQDEAMELFHMWEAHPDKKIY